MTGVSYQIAHLLEKMTSSDKDFRFMATNDLMTELQKDNIKLDDDSERKVVKMLLKLLEDKNGEVQNLAVRCLGPLVGKVKDFQVESIVDHLCNNMVGDKEQLRDISSIGLKTVINELPLTTQSLAASVCKTMTGRLSAAIAQQNDVSVQLEALDILGDLLSRFGGLLVQFHPNLVDALSPQLRSPRLAVRKRATLCLGHLVLSCDQALYNKMVNMLLEELGRAQSGNAANTRTYIQALGAICRQAGHRFGEHVERVMPLVLQFARQEDDELKEHVLQACEAMVSKCGAEMSDHIPAIVQLCLQYLTYDPNYNYEEDEDSDMETEDAEQDGEQSEDEYSDDDDVSWKVRRAAAKCLEAVIVSRHEMLEQFYTDISPALINRFKEREENVKADIFHAYRALLRQTKSTASIVSACDPSSMEAEEGPIAMLQAQVPNIVKALHRQLREKSVKVRGGCFSVLSQLCSVLPGCLGPHLPSIVPGLQYSMQQGGQGNTNSKIDTLQFMGVLLEKHPPTVFHPHCPVLVPCVLQAVADPFYKVSSEALVVLGLVVRVLRPLSADHPPTAFDFTVYTKDIYEATSAKLRAQDIDQEVKERAISCMGCVVAHLGDSLAAVLPVSCLPVLLERLRNEITRLTAVKALATIATSPLRIDLRSILGEILPTLASFLRKNQRGLKLHSLSLLDTLTQNYSDSSQLANSLVTNVLPELPPLVADTDLHLAQLALSLLTSLASHQKQATQAIQPQVLPQVLKLAESPLLQGAALQAMLQFFKAVVAANVPGLSHSQLLSMLVTPVLGGGGGGLGSIHKQGRANIAKCLAALVAHSTEEAVTVVKQLLSQLGTSSSNQQEQAITFILLAMGEVGRGADLKQLQQLKQAVLAAFNHNSEEVKSAASYALGNIALGNLGEYLPFILNEIETQPRRQYLLLHSLKEVISAQSVSPSGVQTLSAYVPSIWSQLYRHMECEEEGTRNVVSECLGKLCLMSPNSLLPKLKESLGSPSPLVRTTVVTAVKFTICDQPQEIDSLLRTEISHFLATLKDPDLAVRRVALVAFNSLAHNKPLLIRDLLKDTLPQLYNETQKRKELIREVEMGPFKHEVDDGLDLRKAAFECMYTLLETGCLDRIDIFQFLSHVQDGLRDHYDIKMLTYLMVARVSQLCPAAVLQKLEKLVEPLKVTCTTKVKANSVKQEYEKQDELKRSAMRAVAALLNIPGADKHPQLNEFITQIKSTPDLANLFESIQKDSAGGGMASQGHADSHNSMDLS